MMTAHPMLADVPAIGDQVSIIDWLPIATARCNCERGSVLLLKGFAPAACPSCHRRYTFGAITFDPSTARCQLQVIQLLNEGLPS